MHIIRKNEVDYLNDLLNLPATEREQDWELELSDSKRVDEFLEIYDGLEAKKDIKRALWALITSSLNDAIEEQPPSLATRQKYEDLLIRDFKILSDVLEVWGQSEDDFPVSRIIAEAKKKRGYPQLDQLTRDEAIRFLMCLQSKIAIDHLYHWDERYHHNDKYRDAYYNFQRLYELIASEVLWHFDESVPKRRPLSLDELEEFYAKIVGSDLAAERFMQAYDNSKRTVRSLGQD